jgi:hypothetical protein
MRHRRKLPVTTKTLPISSAPNGEAIEPRILIDNKDKSVIAERLICMAGAGVADDTGNVDTPTMTLKNAALLARIGTTLMTVLLVWTFVFNVLNALRGLVPAVTLFSSFIYAFGCFSVAVFLYVFHRAQS